MGGPCRKVDIEEVDPFITLGDMATVWDGEIAGMTEGGTEGPHLGRLQATIAAVRKAGRTGKTRSVTLRRWWMR